MKRKAFKAAFPYTLPILTGFSFLGMAYGIYMNASGFSFVYPLWNAHHLLPAECRCSPWNARTS